ncbi:RDD family protein [Psychroflexus maritimus]|uniref:RDD family protein n=1 Tax=Psychroflexus maritimus TaxID=2714865 RepID=A0A967E5S5_9FLAO|nr:RDD family protein [Psychroflexus maritimus]NGZ89001.1 RDD family protein [Psychroflexus maritimus]
MNNFSIETSQNVSILQKPAYLTDRIFAYLIDALIMGVYIFGVFFIVTGVSSTTFSMSLTVVLLLPVMLYHLLFELFNNGQSPGKNALQIRVIKEDGSAPSLGDYLMRWILRLLEITSLSGVIAILSIVFTNKSQRLGDLAAKTIVVSEKREIKQNLFFDIPVDYQPTFEQVIIFTDQDIQRIKNVYLSAKKNSNQFLLAQLQQKIIEKLRIETSLSPNQFILLVLKDYYFITKNQ